MLSKCDDIILAELTGRLPTLYEGLLEDLFQMAEKASNTNEQNAYFDARKAFERDQQAFATRLRSEFSERISLFLKGEAPQNTSTPRELSIVEEESLDQLLAINAIVDRLEGRETAALHALNTRLSALRSSDRITNDDNPYGPRSICEALMRAAQPIEVPTEHRVLLFRQFDRVVLHNFGKVLDAINQELIAAGILPNLEYSVAKKDQQEHKDLERERVEQTANESAAEAKASAKEDPLPGVEAHQHGDAMAQLRDLLAQHRQSIQEMVPPYQPRPDAEQVSSDYLGQVLNNMQQTAARAEQSPFQPSHLRQSLANHLSNGDQQFKLNEQQADTADLVGMLFGYMQQEAELHSRVQSLIGRLQVPLLRVALNDERFFTDKKHPARSLLNMLANTGHDWVDEDEPPNSPLLKKMRKVSDTLLRDYNDDVSVFDKSREELEAHVDRLKKRAEINERRQIEASRGREKLDLAREHADKEVRLRLARQDPPAYVKGLIEEAWADVLALTVLRSGARSDQLREKLRVADDLIDATSKESTPEMREDLRKRSPEILDELKEGLAQVGFQTDDFKEIESNVKKLMSNALDEHKTADGEVVPNEPEPSRVRFGIKKLRAKRDEEPKVRLNEKEQTVLARLRSIPFGSWFECLNDKGQKVLLKLAWYSPVTSRCLFVNRKGASVAERSLQSLARDIVSGKAKQYKREDVPLMDRALQAILSRLRRVANIVPGSA